MCFTLGRRMNSLAEDPGEYLRASSAALKARCSPPSLGAVEMALDAYTAEIAAARRERLTQDLPVEAVERIFTRGFALERLHQNFNDLAPCLDPSTSNSR
jgi:hypothetical protein